MDSTPALLLYIFYNIFYSNNNIHTYTYPSTCITWPASRSNASRSAITIIIIFNYIIVSAQVLIIAKCFAKAYTYNLWAYQSTWLTFNEVSFMLLS